MVLDVKEFSGFFIPMIQRIRCRVRSVSLSECSSSVQNCNKPARSVVDPESIGPDPDPIFRSIRILPFKLGQLYNSQILSLHNGTAARLF